MNKFSDIIFIKGFTRTLSEHDLAGRQRLNLFKITSLFGFIVFAGIIFQVANAEGKEVFLVTMSLMFVGLLTNYFTLAFHRNSRMAFIILLVLSFSMLHLCSYGQGGVRNSGLFYLASLILIAYLMLGKNGGAAMSIASLCHVIYFYLLGRYTHWVDYSLIGTDGSAIDQDFLVTGVLSILLLTALANFIEKSKAAIIADITIKKNELSEKNEKLVRSEEALSLVNQQYAKKNYELVQKNKELEQFNYVATHDLQEPLNTAATFVELLQKQYSGQLDAKGIKYLEYVAHASHRMQALIRDLIIHSNIGRSDQIRLIDTNFILGEVILRLDEQIAESNAEIIIQKLPCISGFEDEIKLLFHSLLFNAIKFRRQGVPCRITISAEQKNENWVFAIVDNGIGISREHASRIFAIFQRLHTRNQYEGSGIGLSHCKKIMELHKGEIWFESVPGEGTSFFFSLPVKSDETAKVPFKPFLLL